MGRKPLDTRADEPTIAAVFEELAMLVSASPRIPDELKADVDELIRECCRYEIAKYRKLRGCE